MGNPNEIFRFEQEPSGDAGLYEWSILRASHERLITFVSLSACYTGIRTHYFDGRTRPCLRFGCRPCLAKFLSRWTGYLLAGVVGSPDKVVFEFTPSARPVLQRVFDEVGTLRAQTFTATRVPKKINGRVHLTPKGIHREPHKLISEPQLWPILSHIWGIRADGSTTFDASSENDRSSEYDAGPDDLPGQRHLLPGGANGTRFSNGVTDGYPTQVVKDLEQAIRRPPAH